MAKTIYTDPQTESMIDAIKESNPNFNLSSFVKECLRDYGNYHDNENIETIEQKINESKHDLDKIKERLDYLEKQKIKILTHHKINEIEKKKEIEEDISRLLKYYDINEKTATNLSLEFHKLEVPISITKFMDNKGYTMKGVQ